MEQGIPDLRINLAEQPWQKCECGGMIFEERIMLKRISALISPTGKEGLRPVPVFVCSSCSKIPAWVHPTMPDVPEEVKARPNISGLQA